MCTVTVSVFETGGGPLQGEPLVLLEPIPRRLKARQYIDHRRTLGELARHWRNVRDSASVLRAPCDSVVQVAQKLPQLNVQW